MIVFLLIFLFVLFLLSTASYITPCKRTDPNREACIREVVEKMKPRLAKGIPELGVPPCDPMVIPKLNLKQPQGSNVGFDAVFTDMTFYHGLDFTLLKSNVDVDAGTVNVKLEFPHLDVEGDYKSKGKIFIAQFEGEGRAKGTFG